MSLERLENNVPSDEMAASWLSRDVSRVFHGVSTFCRLATMDDTVLLTSNPVPLVGEPELSPTVPIYASVRTIEAARCPTGNGLDWEILIALKGNRFHKGKP